MKKVKIFYDDKPVIEFETELEKWLNDKLDVKWHTEKYENTIKVKERIKTIKEVLSKIEELKGSDN